MRTNEHSAKPHRITLGLLLTASTCLLTACNTAHMTLHQPTQPSAFDPIKTANAPVTAKVQVVNFTVNVVNTGSENVTKEQLQQNLQVLAANRIYSSLGRRRAFSEVTRVERSDPNSADYIVSGTYDFSMESNQFFGAHMHYNGTIKVQVVEAKTGAAVFEKTYVEEQSDTAHNRNTAHLQWLQGALIEEISADIRNAIFHKVGIN